MYINIFPIDFATPAFDEAVRLRYDVLRLPLGLDFTAEQIAEEYDEWHLGCYASSGALLGCLTLKKLDEAVVKMRQVAVADLAQRKGVGRKLVEASEEFAQAKGFEEMSLHARDTAIPFYEKLGYESVGEPFVEVNIPHQKMKKKLNR